MLKRGADEVDRVVTPFGIRTIRFDADKGFFLNGKPVKIYGTCNHQDFAGIGIALPDRVLAYKIEKLKEMGANAYRCSHHPFAPELMDECDRQGMLVMDENRRLGDSQEVLSQVESMILRDRNHPSVILWSLCNEERLQGTPEGEKMGKAMKDVINRLDPTRPVTAAMNGGYGGGLSQVVDVQGFNYHWSDYDDYHRDHPTQPMFGSESASVVTTRGIYQQDDQRGYVSAYTTGAEQNWRPVAERPFMAGAFIWTGFDYRGEPSPFGWPCINSHFGVMDTCGFPKDDYYYYHAWWGTKPVLHLVPNWNWAYPNPGKAHEGREITVRAYSNCDRVELFLNGESLGAQDMPPNSHLDWKAHWAPGVLSAKGFKKGKEVVSDRVETAGLPDAIRLTPDRRTIQADGQDCSMIKVEIVDAHGRNVPVADNTVEFNITSNGRIIGVGNGDPSSHEPDKATHRRAFNGLCMAIVQSTRDTGPIIVTATSPTLETATTIIETKAAPPIPVVPVE